MKLPPVLFIVERTSLEFSRPNVIVRCHICIVITGGPVASIRQVLDCLCEKSEGTMHPSATGLEMAAAAGKVGCVTLNGACFVFF